MTPTRDPADLRRERAWRQAEVDAAHRRARLRVVLAILAAAGGLVLLWLLGRWR